MTSEELQQHLLVVGIASRIKREEVQIEVCRFCGNARWNLGLNPTKGLYHCWACNESGRLDVLLRQWLDQDFHIPVQFTKESSEVVIPPTPINFASVPAYDMSSAEHHLTRRGISIDVAARYRLVVCVEVGHLLYGRLVIPTYDFWTNTLLGYIGRTLSNRRPKYLSTLPQRTVTGYRVRPKQAAYVIVEGGFDGIAVHQAGRHAAVLGGISTPHVKEFAARIPPDATVIIMLDGEAETQANRLRWAIQGVRGEAPLFISLPNGRDPGDFTPPALTFVMDRVLGSDDQIK